MKKLFSIAMILCLMLPLCAPALAADTTIFVDSTGRSIALPDQITRVAVTGPMTQHVVFALAPDLLVALSESWKDDAKQYIPEMYQNLPVIGQLYGGKGTMNPEALLASEPQIVLDIGESKAGIAEDLDQLTQQTGIPFLHIDADLFTFDQAFITLGQLLDREAEAEKLAAFCRKTCETALSLADRVDKTSLLYVLGEEGLSVIAKGSYHASVIDLLSDNAAVVDSPSSKGTGNEVDMEQLMIWDPECIIFSSDSIYDTVAGNPLWENLTAVQSSRYYEAPFGPHNWMGFPPTCQRMLGILWLGKLLYPQEANYDLYEEIKTGFDLLYHCDLTRQQFDAIMAHSVGAQP